MSELSALNELFPTTIHIIDHKVQRQRSHTVYFGPKSGYKCHSCSNEYANIRHLNTHIRNRHGLFGKLFWRC